MKAKPFFTIFVVMAAVPLILAFLILKMGWFTPGATNKGQFVEFETTLNLEHDRPTWAIVYQPNESCDKVCSEQLYGLHQTYIALGKLQKRVSAYVLADALPVEDYQKLQTKTVNDANLKADYLYLVDPLGKVIMQYPGSDNRDKTIQTSKDLLADIKKLLKYARIG